MGGVSRWQLLGIAVLAAVLMAAGATLALIARSHAVTVLTDVLVAPTSLVVSVVALAIARNQAVSAQLQVNFARDQARYTGEQTRLAALAVANAYRPIVVPVHVAVPVQIDPAAEPYYPALTPFTVPSPVQSDRVFLVDRRQGDALVRLRNVGAGPAILLPSFLFDHRGQRAALTGNLAIAPGGEERYSARIAASGASVEGFSGPDSDALRPVWTELRAERHVRERAFLLVVRYLSLAPGAEPDVVEAIYDPRGTGSWRSALLEKQEPVERQNPGQLTGVPGS
jgi:hypothetical protein